MKQTGHQRPGLLATARDWRRRPDRNDDGLTLVEMLVAFAVLMLLFTITATALSTYLTAGTTVVSSYSATDQFLNSQIIIQRLFRSQVEPAPTPAAGTTACSSAANIPCPPFLAGSVGTYSVTFYANIGDPNGPAKIVMAESTPTKCASCSFYTSAFIITEYRANASTCPTTATATNSCTWSSTGTELAYIPDIVNGAATVASPVTACGQTDTTPLCQSSTPIFTYNTLDPYAGTYVPGNGGTPSATTGILPTFNSCAAPTYNAGGDPTQANCPPDMIQSVGVDLEVQVPGAPLQENAYTVYRLSSASYLYSTLVG
ncbi:MAG: type II secretion system protein J [Acidimicrobiales bacterium]